MKRLFVLGVLATVFPPCFAPDLLPLRWPRVFANDAVARKTLGSIERLDRRFDALVPPGTVLEVVADGFNWLEGPVWEASSRSLLFSDIPGNTVFRWREGEGVSRVLKPSGYTGSAPFLGREPGSNGLALDAQGRLVLCQHGDRRIVRREQDGTLVAIAERYQGRRLNSPNDLAFRSGGDLYFTDPPFGLPKQFDDEQRELPFSGVFRVTPAGELALVSDALRAPNGLAFSPDERTLYVSNADPARPAWFAFDLRPDGSAGEGRVFADATRWLRDGTGLPDGLKADRHGNLFATGPGGIYVFTPAGELLGTIRTGVPTANLNWGGDGSVLYVTADTMVARLRTTTRGARF